MKNLSQDKARLQNRILQMLFASCIARQIICWYTCELCMFRQVQHQSIFIRLGRLNSLWLLNSLLFNTYLTYICTLFRPSMQIFWVYLCIFSTILIMLLACMDIKAPRIQDLFLIEKITVNVTHRDNTVLSIESVSEGFLTYLSVCYGHLFCVTFSTVFFLYTPMFNIILDSAVKFWKPYYAYMYFTFLLKVL